MRDPATTGTFYYNSGHTENHASELTQLGNVDSLGKRMQPLLGAGATIACTDPLMSGGIRTSAGNYAVFSSKATTP